jgi:type IV pilus assembly protein PilC
MATTAAAKNPPAARTNPLQQFVWEGTDKRGVKMKGESSSKNANLLKAELRKQGINPTVVRAKSTPLFGNAGKAIRSPRCCRPACPWCRPSRSWAAARRTRACATC